MNSTKNQYIHESLKKLAKDELDSVELSTRTIRFSDAVESYAVTKILGIIGVFQQCSTEPVNVVINSPGGSVYEAIYYYDHLRLLHVPVNTLISGCAMSAASVMAVGTTGHRRITPNSFIMIHEISSWEMGEVSKLKNRIQHIERMQELLINMYVKHSKEKDRKKWEEVLQQETYFNAQQALELGLVDEITTV